MKKFALFVASLLVVLPALVGAQVAPAPLAPQGASSIRTITVMPWDLEQNPALVGQLKAKGFTHATVYLPWIEVEPQKGQFSLARNTPFMDALTRQGLSLIVVLDFGGRPYFNRKGRLTRDLVIPSWVIREHKQALARDFQGTLTGQLSFTDARVRERVGLFIDKSVEVLSQRYPGQIAGFALGLQEEHEIKYGQIGYRWRDHSAALQKEFKAKYGGAMPLVNYNNDVARGTPAQDALFMPYMAYREARLRDAVCHYAGIIRRRGQPAMGYFAEPFSSHDAIYATGIVEEVAHCLDVAVMDFNFYDGYGLKAEPYTLPLLASYLKSLGYPKVLVGAYAEFWAREGKARQLQPVMEQSLALASQVPGVVGYEVGGLQTMPDITQSGIIDTKALPDLTRLSAAPAPVQGKRFTVGVLGSKTNFYLWHGERSQGRNVHQDALTQTYRLLSHHAALDVRVIGEKNLTEGDPVLKELQAIVIPHQAALKPQTKAALKAFWQRGGVLVQDMRAGEFDDNGKPTGDWMHEVFGIAGLAWKTGEGQFVMEGKTLRLAPSKGLYATYAALVPQKKFTLLAPEKGNPSQGLMVSGERSLVFGFMPQLVDDATRPQWTDVFVEQILRKLRAAAAPASTTAQPAAAYR